jgi:hypothetical protein
MQASYPDKFILLCHARTGSALFGSLLASHPAIYWAGEDFKRDQRWQGLKGILHPLVWRYPVYYLDYQARRYGRPVYGCKLAPSYVQNITATIAHLHRRGWLIVHLWRRNKFQEALSVLVARRTGRYQRRVALQEATAPLLAPTLEIEPGQLLDRIGRLIQRTEREQRALVNVPHLEVVYDDDLADSAGWDDAAGRVFDALGLARHSVTTRIQKTWDRPYSDIVVNYAELVQAVRESRYAFLLPDDER